MKKIKVVCSVLVVCLFISIFPNAVADAASSKSPKIMERENGEIVECQEIYELGDVKGGYPDYIDSVKFGAEDIQLEGTNDISSQINAPVTISSVTYETESNNSYGYANTYIDNNDMYGKIGIPGDVDWYKVSWAVDGNANFYVGNIPTSCNYNLKVYSQPKAGGSLTLIRTSETVGTSETIINVPVTNDMNYYMHVYSTLSYSASQNYLLRAKITPIGDSMEPNNTFDTATSKTTATGFYATIHKLQDVDYYRISASSGVLDVNLQNIPSGCNYQFSIYDISRVLVASSSGTGNKQIVIPIASGTYYIKVNSVSGFSTSVNYYMSIGYRTPSTTVSGYIKPNIKQQGGGTMADTPIAAVPVKIVYTYGTYNNEATITSAITNSSGYFTTNFSLPTNVKHLYVKLLLDDTTLSVQKIDGTVQSFLFEIPFTASSVSVNLPGTTITDNVKSSLSLWRLMKMGIGYYSNYSSRSLGKLNMRCEGGTSHQTEYQSLSNAIYMDGSYSSMDYYDFDVLLHELGHLIMSKNGGLPLISGGSHNWGNASTVGTAYSEGWAHYVTTTLRNSSYTRDYNSSNQYFGGDVSNGTVVTYYGYTPYDIPMQVSYNDNERYEINTASALWKLMKTLGSSYGTLENIMTNRSESFDDYYDKYMNTLGAGSSNQKRTAWQAFEVYGCAFDMQVPIVSVTVSGMTAYTSISDNVYVERFDWYIDGTKYGATQTGSSGSIDLSGLGLYAGTHVIECRAYDTESLATGARPRDVRYGSGTSSFVITSLKSASEPMASEQIATGAELSAAMNDSDKNHLSLGIGDSSTVTAEASGYIDLYFYATIKGGLRGVIIRDPDGKIYDEIPYLSADNPYVIKMAQAGTWSIEFVGLTQKDIKDMLKAQELKVEDDKDIDSLPSTPIDIVITARPSAVNVSIPEFTSDPAILQTILGDSPAVVIKENGRIVPLDVPLGEGTHILSFCRLVDGALSDETIYSVTIDTIAPMVSYYDLKNTSKNRIVIAGECSSDAVAMYVNGERQSLSDSGFSNFWILKPGVNTFKIMIVDGAGNVFNDTITAERS